LVINYGGNMKKVSRDERHKLLKKRIEENPFINDEELAEAFSVSIATIRLDRLALAIPELRIRIKQRAVAAGSGTKSVGVVGELIERIPGESGISVMTAMADMVDDAHIVKSQYLYAQASSLAKSVLDIPVCIMTVGNVKYKQPVTVGDKLVAQAEVIRKREGKRYVWVKIRKNAKEVFRAKFIIESLE